MKESKVQMRENSGEGNQECCKEMCNAKKIIMCS